MGTGEGDLEEEEQEESEATTEARTEGARRKGGEGGWTGKGEDGDTRQRKGGREGEGMKEPRMQRVSSTTTKDQGRMRMRERAKERKRREKWMKKEEVNTSKEGDQGHMIGQERENT